MANKIVQEIRDKYEFYTKLLAERKSIFDKVIEIIQLGNNRNFLEKSTELKHIPVTDETILIVTVKVYDYKYFQFKLRCKGLSDTPFFR